MLGALYGGKTAAESAGKLASVPDSEPEALGRASADWMADRMVSPAHTDALCAILRDGLGIVRDEDTLTAAIRRADDLLAGELTGLERARSLLGKAMLVSALERRESRGAHCRSDFPNRDDEHFRRTTAAVCRDGDLSLTFRPIPERRIAGGNPTERKPDHGTHP